MSDAPTPIVVRQLQHGFATFLGPRREVLRGVDFELQKGQGLLLMGPNGAGKTTLLQLILGLRRVQRGTVSVMGADASAAEAKVGVGAMMEHGRLPARMSGRALLLRLGQLHRMLPEQRAARATELIGRLQLANVADLPIANLSMGQRQRFKLAAALVHEPQLLVLDEPLNALDAETVRFVVDLLTEVRRRGTATLIATHRLADLAPIGGKAATIRGGKLEQLGPVSEVLSVSPAVVVFTLPEGAQPPHLGEVRPCSPPLFRRWVSVTHRDRLLAEIQARGGHVLRVQPDTRNFSTAQADVQETLA